jgi:aspartate/tyrosine/aromatic aminotransferase
MDHQAFAQLLGNYGEFVGSVGVVGTLFYVAIQIRNQIRESRASAINSLTQQWATVTLLLCEPNLNRLWQEGLADFHSLEDTDRGRFSAYLQNITQTFEGLYLQNHYGRMDAESWAAIERRMQSIFSAPGVKQWWSVRSSWYTDRFQLFLGQLIDGTKGENHYLRFFDRPDDGLEVDN